MQAMAIVERPLNATDNRQLVGNLCLQRHQFRDFETGDVRSNGLELAANLGRRLGLQIVHIEVAWPAVQADHDDRLVRCIAGRCPLRPQPQQIGQSECSA
jgi:hypothetical protein